jgi:aminopeptidase
MSYTPSPEYLERYADLLVGYALGGGAGIEPGDTVLVIAPESAKPLFVEICRAVWKAGGNVIQQYTPDNDAAANLSRDFYELAGKAQLGFFAETYQRGLIDQIDHLAYVRCDADPHSLQGVDPARIMTRQSAHAPLVKWQTEKENAGRFSWTVGMYGTKAMAAEARLSLGDYWQQIIHACFLDDPDPKARWREVQRQIDMHTARLNALPIDRLHVQGEDADLWLTLGEKRRWIGGGGRNIPSFEIFTTPDWRGTEGWIRFSEPLYLYGDLVTGIELEFQAGRVVRARAEQNEQLLTELIATAGSDAVGEFSLTDSRLSRITQFMADTLFDENVGGPFGNTHVAIGLGLKNCYDGDPEPLTEADWTELGFNESAVHTDIVSTTDRTVTAVLRDGSERPIYAGGQFTLEG